MVNQVRVALTRLSEVLAEVRLGAELVRQLAWVDVPHLYHLILNTPKFYLIKVSFFCCNV